MKIYCECCACRIQIESDLDERICEECRSCPHGDGPCAQIGEVKMIYSSKPKLYFNYRYFSAYIGLLVPKKTSATYGGMIMMIDSKDRIRTFINPKYLSQYHFEEIGEL